MSEVRVKKKWHSFYFILCAFDVNSAVLFVVLEHSRNCWFHLQNEIKTRLGPLGDSKNEIGFDAHHVFEQNEIKTRPINLVEKCQNLRNEIKTRWRDSVNLLYCGSLYVFVIHAPHYRPLC